MELPLNFLTNEAFKRLFLPAVSSQILFNRNTLQLYNIQDYLKGIRASDHGYKTTFNFLIFVTQGRVVQQYEDLQYVISQGQCLNVNRGIHTKTIEVSADAEGFIAIYEEEVLTHFLWHNSKPFYYNYAPFFPLDDYEMKAMLASFIILDEELRQPQNRADIYLNLFFSILSRLSYHAEGVNWNLRDVQILYRFKELVKDHYMEHRPVAFYADLLTVSESYLNKCVKRVMGMSTKQWINEIFIRRSQILLQDPTKDIAEIAYALNFHSPSYFTRFFKKVTGITPTAYRANLQISPMKSTDSLKG
ncbi:helix-turn-helix domain-containing protein [Flavobacterium sp. JP2137]|uniref:helix-turn-helix domain-containing protein n=1 Tax=Flavobacterium sp. JP2137 TaxID=3414510 RepID=UPI003D300D28